jgi:hypothetical protein
MDKVLAFSNKVEGRDKTMKMIQYGCRFLKAQDLDKSAMERVQGLFNASKDARKMFRLVKSVHEVDKIMNILVDLKGDLPYKTLEVLSRAAYFVYWILDNLVILSAVKLLRAEVKPLTKASSFAWFLGIFLGLVNQLRELGKNIAQESKASDTEHIKNIKTKRNALIIGIIKNCGDFIPAANGSEVALKVFGRQFNESLAGLGGFVSASLSAWQAWPA